MALEESFTYTVVPRRPIRNLVKGKCIIKETTLSLTKSEVKECLKYGKVYRKFYLESSEMERVTPSNLDRLHRSNHISEADYNNLSGKGDKTVSELLNDRSGTVKSQPEEQHEKENVEIIDHSTEDEVVAVEVKVKKAEEEQLSTDNSLILADAEDIDDSEIKKYQNTTEHDNVDKADNTNHNSPNHSRSKKKKNKYRTDPETSSVPKTAEESN